jgi:hypothetical protein
MGKEVKFRIRKQGGVSLTGIIFMLVILGSLFILGMRIVPAVIEYKSIRNAVAQAKARGGSVAQIREAFGKDASVNDITSISGKDLEITREGDHFEVAFEYERRIPLVANATLLLAFSGSTDPSLKGPSKTAEAAK